MTDLDRYLARQEFAPFVATLAIVVAMLSLENIPRLWGIAGGTNAPALLMIRMMSALIPEYLAVALPLASFIAPAWAIRSMARRGEWQLFAALGQSPARMLLAPMLIAALAALTLLAIRMEVEPWGERALDEISIEVRNGTFGLPIPLDEFISLDSQTDLYAAPVSVGQTGVGSVFISRGDTTYSAAHANARRGQDGRIELELENGLAVQRQADGQNRVLRFGKYRMAFDLKQEQAIRLPLLDRLDRMPSLELGRKAALEQVRVSETSPAMSALLARISSAIFCLALPWVALALAVPPRRKSGGAGAFIGIAAIVLFMRTSHAVETGFSAQPALAALVHLSAWAIVTATLFRFAQNHEEGAVDLAISRLGSRVLKTVRRPA